MADTKKNPAEKQEQSWFARCINWFKKLPGRIATPFRNMVNELKRVTWPTKRKLLIYSITVLVFMLFMMVVVGAFDLGSSTLVRSLHNVGGTKTTQTAVVDPTDVVETTENTEAAVEEAVEGAETTAEQAADGAEAAVEEAVETAAEEAADPAAGE